MIVLNPPDKIKRQVFSKHALWLISSILFFIGISSCSPTKKLLPGEYLVEKVEVVNAQETRMTQENFATFFRQKPNRKFLRTIHFYVWWYNQFSEEKIAKKRLKRNVKYDRINAKRIQKSNTKNEKRKAKGKNLKDPKLKNKESALVIESVRDIGEPAVVFDSLLTYQTRLQLSKYMFTKGYFNNKVTDSIEFKRNNKRARVKYYLYPGKVYTITEIGYDMQDKEIGAIILKDTVNTILKRGMLYDEEKLQQERQRVTNFALNNGYYYFDNAYVNYTVDTTMVNHSLKLKERVKKFSDLSTSLSDSLRETEHVRYKINKVFFITEPSIGDARSLSFKDTMYSLKHGLFFLANKPLAYKQKLLVNNTSITSDRYYNKDSAQFTYKQLLGIGLFRNVTIRFYKDDRIRDQLNCYIVCNPLLKQAVTLETQGTNTSGNLGIDGSLLYSNRNTFRGGELIELKLQGSIAAQQPINSITSTTTPGEETAGSPERVQRTFNTLQFGPELRFSIPKTMFPFTLLPHHKVLQPRTYVSTSLNYQIRAEFNRTILGFDFGYSFKTMNRQLSHDFIPLQLYYVKAILDPAFEQDLIDLQDAFMLNSFQDHFTPGIKYSISYTSKESAVSGNRPAYFAKLNLMSSGNILRMLYSVSDQPKDTNGSYQLAGIPFSQFLKIDIDVRTYVPIRKKSRMVYRVLAGVGKPLANLSVLPYEQSFFSGGPNSVRAWRARTLGPGSYNPGDNQTRYDKIGDIILEGNIEYRFHMIRNFFGALFLDAGNIWRLEPDPTKEGGEFKFSTFADQIAIGGGVGLRWDLTFFILRLDLAMPMKDPKFEPGNRWTFDKQGWEFSVLNFGIGYPF